MQMNNAFLGFNHGGATLLFVLKSLPKERQGKKDVKRIGFDLALGNGTAQKSWFCSISLPVFS